MREYTKMISVIVPVYNVESYLDECIESIRRQTYRNLQIILIDDGSTDFSGKICDEYALKDDRIEVFHQKNQGLVVARKQGLKIAKGEYIGFVDGDDYIEPQMYETLLLELEKAQADMVHACFWQNNCEKCGTEKEVIELDEDGRREELFKRFINRKNHVMTASIWSKLFNERLIREAYALVEDDVSYGEDVVCICAVILMAKKICTLDKALYHYRVREDSISHSISIEIFKKTIRVYFNICDILAKFNRFEELKEEMDVFLVKHLLFGMRKMKQYEFPVQKFYFPVPEKLQNKKVLLYGAGEVGRDFYAQISRYTECEVVAWVDAHPENFHYSYVKVYGLDSLDDTQFDILLIAVKNELTYKEIERGLIDRQISAEKIMWEKPVEMF